MPSLPIKFLIPSSEETFDSEQMTAEIKQLDKLMTRKEISNLLLERLKQEFDEIETTNSGIT